MARAKDALASLPWVDHKSVKADVKVQEVYFAVDDMSQFDEQQLKDAFAKKKFDTIAVVTKPKT